MKNNQWLFWFLVIAIAVCLGIFGTRWYMAEGPEFTCAVAPMHGTWRDCRAAQVERYCGLKGCFKQEKAFCTFVRDDGKDLWPCMATMEECEGFRKALQEGHSDQSDIGPCLEMRADDPSLQ